MVVVTQRGVINVKSSPYISPTPLLVWFFSFLLKSARLDILFIHMLSASLTRRQSSIAYISPNRIICLSCVFYILFCFFNRLLFTVSFLLPELLLEFCQSIEFFSSVFFHDLVILIFILSIVFSRK